MGKRPEYRVSFCLVQEGEVASEIEAIRVLAAHCEQMLDYSEILYVVGESHREAIRAVAERLTTLNSVRIVLVRDGVGYYRRRKIGASEAIGDVVVLTSFAEMPNADLIGFAELAIGSGRVVIGRQPRRGLFQPLSQSIVGLISQYRVDSRDLKTLALPRNALVAILARPTAPIDLRFESKRGTMPYMRKEIRQTIGGGEAGLQQRLELLAEIISNSASRFLSAFAVAAGFVSLIAASYGVYAVVIILTKDNVQPGWFSTAIVQSGSAAFISLGMSVIALGIGNILDRLDADPGHEIVDEIGNISFYDRINDFNVEMNSELSEVNSR